MPTGFSGKRSLLNLVSGAAGAEIRSQWTGRDLIRAVEE